MHISFDAAIQGHADLPRSRKDLLILDSGLVVQAIGTGCCDALDNVQFVTVEIADAIEPSLIVKSSRIDDQRFAFPMSVRPAHPTVGWSLRRLTHVDGSDSAGIFENHHGDIFALDDLKRKGHVHRARHTGKIAFDLGIQRQPLFVVFLLLRQIRDFASFDPTDSRRRCVLRTKSHHASEIRCVRQKVPIGLVQRLPNTV